jgi:glyoxylase-like metal-dependent hydrolase (beta-lactamase superfamily II)
LLLTHIHGDHAAGAYYFHKEYGLKVYAAQEAAPWLEQGDMERTSVNAAKRAGVYEADFQYPACPVAGHLLEGDRIKVGELELQVLDTPGHSRGHVSFVMEEGGFRSLFAGDTIFANGKIYVQNSWDCSIQEYAASIAKLHELKFDRLYPGHGTFVVNRAGEHIARAHRCFEQLDLPPNL